jgi:DNA-binding transcriptional MerR regulator
MSRLVTVKELAAELSVHPHTVQSWCRDGIVPHTRIPGRNGGEYRLDPVKVRRALDFDRTAHELAKTHAELRIALDKATWDSETTDEEKQWASEALRLILTNDATAIRAIEFLAGKA